MQLTDTLPSRTLVQFITRMSHDLKPCYFFFEIELSCTNMEVEIFTVSSFPFFFVCLARFRTLVDD